MIVPGQVTPHGAQVFFSAYYIRGGSNDSSRRSSPVRTSRLGDVTTPYRGHPSNASQPFAPSRDSDDDDYFEYGSCDGGSGLRSSSYETEPDPVLDPTLPASTYKVLDAYQGIVRSEMVYLRDNGGRRYKVTDGRYIDRVGHGYAYGFELEAELYLAEDAPISLRVGEADHKGSVLSSEEFQIIVIMADDLGPRVATGFISIEPWKLLDSLNRRLLSAMHPSSKIALALIEEGPHLTTNAPISQADTGQEAAIEHALRDPVTIIWGPPGTGKTHTMAEIAIRAMRAGKRVLAVSHSNISVDGVVAKVAELMRAKGMQAELERGRVLRFGHTRDDALAHDDQVVSYHYALKRLGKADELERLLAQRDALKAAGENRTPKALEVENKLKVLRKGVADEEKRCVLHARMVATTVSRLYANKLFEEESYDVVLFDEVSMAYVPQVFCAATYAREHMICVGDFRQLPPIAQGKQSKKLAHDIFWYLSICDSKQHARYHPWLVMLNEQRRMHPAISSFPARAFYGGLLKDYPGVKEQREPVARQAPLANSAMALIDLSGTFCVSDKNSDNSRFNILSAVVSLGIALTASREGHGDPVGVIAPYAAQCRLVKAMVQDVASRRGPVDIACSTVHQFQGSERNTIVIDMVESFPSKQPGILMRDNDNGQVDRLVNVAVTRARGKLVTVANARWWELKTAAEENAFERLIAHHKECDTVIGTKRNELAHLLEGLDFGPNIKVFLDQGQAFEKFLDDIDRAKQRIVFSISDGCLDSVQAGRLLDHVLLAQARGVDVLLKCVNWNELPEDWQRIGWQSNDAVHPLVLIDDRRAWYGMPASRGRLTDKGGQSFTAVFKMAVRIEGDRTVDMIKSLTEIGSRLVDGQSQPLRPRTIPTSAGPKSTRVQTPGATDGKQTTMLKTRLLSDTTNPKEAAKRGGEADGLAGYIRANVRCPACASPMMLARGYKTGKFYLKCTSCSETGFVERDTVNAYLERERVVCPTCGSYLQARLGKFGMYIRCGEGHTVKLNEV